MARPDNVAAIRMFYGHVDRKEWDAAMQVFADDFLLHMSGNPQPMTTQEFFDFGKMFSAAIPDLTHTIDAVVADGDDVAIRLTVTGTHQHELMGVPGTGRAVALDAFNFYRFRDGVIVEQWINFDALGLMQQIGALPAVAAA